MDTCTKTSRFPNQGAALRALTALQTAHPEREERGVHHCRQHDTWHFTTDKGYTKRVNF